MVLISGGIEKEFVSHWCFGIVDYLLCFAGDTIAAYQPTNFIGAVDVIRHVLWFVKHISVVCHLLLLFQRIDVDILYHLSHFFREGRRCSLLSALFSKEHKRRANVKTSPHALMSVSGALSAFLLGLNPDREDDGMVRLIEKDEDSRVREEINVHKLAGQIGDN